MDYNQIKAISKKQKCSFKELIVLAPQNDPFYIGTKSQVKLAKWFAELWEQFGYTNGTHLRRIHYQIVSQDPPISFPNSVLYENTEDCWMQLGKASKYARYLKLVDPAAFEDRRNPEPFINMVNNEKPYITVNENHSWRDLDFPSFPLLPTYQIENYFSDQKYHIEIWAEKSTMNDVLVPLCAAHKVNLATALGEFSITSVVQLIERLRRYEKPCRILYISDFDPAGLSMPVTASRKIEKFLRDTDEIFDVRLIPIILTHEQCKEFELPRTPIKESEKRGNQFEKRFGEGATELDALEALHPGALREILRDAILSYRDLDLTFEVAGARTELRENLDAVHDMILDEHKDVIKKLKKEHKDLTDEFQAKANSLFERIENEYLDITYEMQAERLDITDYPIPEAKDADELPGVLLNSGWDYGTQLVTYKDFQGKHTRVKKRPQRIVKRQKK